MLLMSSTIVQDGTPLLSFYTIPASIFGHKYRITARLRRTGRPFFRSVVYDDGYWLRTANWTTTDRFPIGKSVAASVEVVTFSFSCPTSSILHFLRLSFPSLLPSFFKFSLHQSVIAIPTIAIRRIDFYRI